MRLVQFVRADGLAWTEYTESDKLKERCLIFLTGLYRLHTDDETITVESPLDLLSQKYIEDLYCTKIEPYIKVQGPAEISYSPKPPYILCDLQKNYLNYLALDLRANETHRLKEYYRLTKAEYDELVVVSTKKQASSNHSNKQSGDNKLNFSEEVAWNIYSSHESFLKLKKENPKYTESSDIKENIKNKIVPSLKQNIKIDLHHNAKNEQEMAFHIDSLEDILILDMYFFIKSNHFIFRCPHCGIIFERNRKKSHFCCTSCKNKHQAYVKSRHEPWKTYERIRKKLYARSKSKKYYISNKQYVYYQGLLKNSLDSFFESEVDAIQTQNELLNIEKEIDKIVNDIKVERM